MIPLNLIYRLKIQSSKQFLLSWKKIRRNDIDMYKVVMKMKGEI